MRWRFIEAIEVLEPGVQIVGRACSDFPDELFADHFPGFAVTPGVLCVEMGAQLAGLLVQATIYEQRGRWVLPLLATIERARFRAMVMPHTPLRVHAKLEQVRPEGAMSSATIERVDDPTAKAVVSLRLMLAFDLTREHPSLHESPRRFAALGSPWTPAPPAD
ncbi:MAG: hypothetical protein R6X02_09300 [Enhygromyxa sp.]